MNEGQFQKKLINRVTELLPGCVILRNDPRQMQGIPDILILFRDKWAMLEIKMDEDSNKQPNQEYYVEMLGEMSFVSFITPDTEEAVLHDLQQSFGLIGEARIS